MADYLHSFRAGLITGADFVGAYITKNSFSPGHLAREYGLISHDFVEKPYERTNKPDMNLGERVVEIIGESIGLASNLLFFVPELFGANPTTRANRRAYSQGVKEHPGVLLLESGMRAPAIWDTDSGYCDADYQRDRQKLIEAMQLAEANRQKLKPA
jgi:hypothetical protein